VKSWGDVPNQIPYVVDALRILRVHAARLVAGLPDWSNDAVREHVQTMLLMGRLARLEIGRSEHHELPGLQELASRLDVLELSLGRVLDLELVTDPEGARKAGEHAGFVIAFLEAIEETAAARPPDLRHQN
jgi:hypothetical protein